MRKISFKLSREIITALANICRASFGSKSGDNLFDAWLEDTLQSILLKLAKYRNRTSSSFSVSFTLVEIIAIREASDLFQLSSSSSDEPLLIQNYILSKALSLV